MPRDESTGRRADGMSMSVSRSHLQAIVQVVVAVRREVVPHPQAGRFIQRARVLAARKVSGWPKRCELAHAFLWEHSYKRLKLGQLQPLAK